MVPIKRLERRCRIVGTVPGVIADIYGIYLGSGEWFMYLVWYIMDFIGGATETMINLG